MFISTVYCEGRKENQGLSKKQEAALHFRGSILARDHRRLANLQNRERRGKKGVPHPGHQKVAFNRKKVETSSSSFRTHFSPGTFGEVDKMPLTVASDAAEIPCVALLGELGIASTTYEHPLSMTVEEQAAHVVGLEVRLCACVQESTPLVCHLDKYQSAMIERLTPSTQ